MLPETEGKSGHFLDGVQSARPTLTVLGTFPPATPQRPLKTPPTDAHALLLAVFQSVHRVTGKAVRRCTSGARKQAFLGTRAEEEAGLSQAPFHGLVTK